MLMRTDPFRELDRLAVQVLGTTTRPEVMPMGAWCDGAEHGAGHRAAHGDLVEA